MFEFSRLPKLKASILVLSGLTLVWLLTGCGKGEGLTPDELFPGTDALPGWNTVGSPEVFNRDNLYDFVDGQADAFIVYGFERVLVQNYENAEGAMVSVEVWQLANSADAYGLFTISRAGSPVDIGQGGDSDPGRRLAFWQDRYLVQVRARQTLPDTDLQMFAQAFSSILPSGGEVPELVGRLPSEGLIEQSIIFFHEEISIQDRIWLGGENLLGLSPQTDGVLAEYDLDGTKVQLLLVQYPDAETAAWGMGILASRSASGLVVSDARDTLLGAIYGEVDEVGHAAAIALLGEALGSE